MLKLARYKQWLLVKFLKELYEYKKADIQLLSIRQSMYIFFVIIDHIITFYDMINYIIYIWIHIYFTQLQGHLCNLFYISHFH